MIVVADTSPLKYLVLIGHVAVLQELYGRVVIPSGVASELSDARSPEAVRTWAGALPGWLEVRRVQVPVDAGLDAVDPGEAEAIVLAEASRSESLLIIDDRDGRREATRRGITTTGTLGILIDAAGRGLLDLADAFDRLDRTTFSASPTLLREILDRQSKRS